MSLDGDTDGKIPDYEKGGIVRLVRLQESLKTGVGKRAGKCRGSRKQWRLSKIQEKRDQGERAAAKGGKRSGSKDTGLPIVHSPAPSVYSCSREGRWVRAWYTSYLLHHSTIFTLFVAGMRAQLTLRRVMEPGTPLRLTDFAQEGKLTQFTPSLMNRTLSHRPNRVR